MTFRLRTIFFPQVKVIYSDEWPYVTDMTIGEQNCGIPYTMRKVHLHGNSPLFKKSPCLFKTAAMKHSLQVASSPYHYIVSLNKNGTTWALRHLESNCDQPPLKIQVCSIYFPLPYYRLLCSENNNAQMLVSMPHVPFCMN